MLGNQYTQQICLRCAHTIVNGEPPEDMSEMEFQTMQDALNEWAKDNYVPVEQLDEDKFFVHERCELCDALPGDRVEFIFEKTDESPVPDDAYKIQDNPNGGVEVFDDMDKPIGTFEDMDEAIEEIGIDMDKKQFWPDIYFINDHSNVDLLDSEGNIVQSRV
jgi:hypothetical protein